MFRSLFSTWLQVLVERVPSQQVGAPVQEGDEICLMHAEHETLTRSLHQSARILVADLDVRARERKACGAAAASLHEMDCVGFNTPRFITCGKQIDVMT